MFASHMLLPLNNNTMRDGKGYANIGMLLTYKGWRHDGGWGSKQRCRRVVPGPGRAETRGSFRRRIPKPCTLCKLCRHVIPGLGRGPDTAHRDRG